MAHLHKSLVTLRIMGDDLMPPEITRLLGAPPTHSKVKGEKRVGKRSGQETIARSGIWSLSSSARIPADINGQIHEILSQLTADIAVWKEVTKRYHADLFCGLFLSCSNEGLSVSAASLEALGVRGIELGLDIYGMYRTDGSET